MQKLFQQKIFIQKLNLLSEEKRTMVFYESPHRITKFLAEIAALWPECPTFIGRELTKKFEEQLTGKISEIAVKFDKKKPKGEFVVLLGEPRIEDVPATS